jgi:rare lipoprotein A
MKHTVLALALSGALLAASPALASDPVTDFLGSIFGTTASAAVSPHRISRHGRHRESYSGGSTVMASYYGGGGRGEGLSSHTASGERFNPNGSTCAHRTLPLGTRLIVSHNGRSAECRVNDRGPALATGRSLDLSKGVAVQLGLINAGVGRVQITRLN